MLSAKFVKNTIFSLAIIYILQIFTSSLFAEEFTGENLNSELRPEIRPRLRSEIRPEIKSVLRKEIEKEIRNSGIKRERLGILLGSSLINQKLGGSFELNITKKFVPASISKILVASTALKLFSSSKRFKTELFIDGSVKGRSLKGNLYLKGGGDPSFTTEKMWKLVNDFYFSGIENISGDIVVDDNIFDQVRFDPGRLISNDDSADAVYNAPVGGMSFDWNSVKIIVRPGISPGKKAVVSIDPVNNYIRLINQTQTTFGVGSSIKIKGVEERNYLPRASGNTIHVTGNIDLHRKEYVQRKNITEPDYWSGYNLREFLRQRGIKVQGVVRKGIVPGKAKVKAVSFGKTVGEILADMMKYSNNFIAEMLTKNFDVETQARNGKVTEPGTLADGIKVIEENLYVQGIDASNYDLVSPSGLSRVNFFRPKDIYRVLIDMGNNWNTFPEFLVAQSIAGVDGTLFKRMDGEDTKGYVRAKTGTLDGVISLAGYVISRDGELMPFVFMYNGEKLEHWSARRLFDRLAKLLAK